MKSIVLIGILLCAFPVLGEKKDKDKITKPVAKESTQLVKEMSPQLTRDEQDEVFQLLIQSEALNGALQEAYAGVLRSSEGQKWIQAQERVRQFQGIASKRIEGLREKYKIPADLLPLPDKRWVKP